MSVAFDRQEQVDQITSGLMPDEVAVAVYDASGAGTGFVGVTNMRVILQDKSFVGKKVAITSIPFDRVTSVSMLSNKSWAGTFFSTSSIAINVGAQTYTADFRGTDKAKHIHNLILHYMRATR
jgi:PH (Pleckstrin Homology) domain-containing protein